MLGTKQRGFTARRLGEVFKALHATSPSADEATIPPASSDAWGSFYQIQFLRGNHFAFSRSLG